MKTLRWVPVVLLATGLTGCGFVVETVARGALGANAPTPGFDAPAPTFSVLGKVVADKVPPTTLVARDGSTCQVPRPRFDYIRIGQSVACVWTGYSFRASVRPRY